MICCDDLIHPFQNDPGVSQRQRVIEDLLSGSAKIDGRSMADLLDYFVQLSHHINYYDSNLLITDWSTFFKGSFPFLLSGIIKYKKEKVQNKFDKLNRLFDKHPSRQSLQLLVHFVYFNTIYRVNEWHTQLKESELKAGTVIEKLIKDKLKKNVKIFICLTNNAVQKHQIKKLDFSALRQNDAWGFTNNDWIDSSCFNSTAATKRKRLIALRNKIAELFPIMLNSLSIAGSAAELSMDESLFPVKEEFQKNHPPHLALLFAFLKLFKHLQSDLNSYTKKHLDFFYQKVLQLKPREATADKAHVLFEIQKELDKYLVKKGVQVKDGKDIKKAEINFALKDEIVVNKTTVGDVKTLFLNNKLVLDARDNKKKSYIEGVYMAPDARKADGIKIDFKDDGPKNWPTLGNKLSKYKDPEEKYYLPYPNARLGFILASPVLLLSGGTRTIDINLACELQEDICAFQKEDEKPKNKCCEEIKNGDADKSNGHAGKPETLPCAEEQIGQLNLDHLKDETAERRLARLAIFNSLLNADYYYISEEIVDKAIKSGVGKDIIDKLRAFLLIRGSDDKPERLCYCPTDRYNYDTVVEKDLFEDAFSPDQLKIMLKVFKPSRLLKISFSGKDKWIEPDPGSTQMTLVFQDLTRFTLHVETILDTDKDGVTFFDKDKLKEDYDTKLPVVKIELDDHIKLHLEKTKQNPIKNIIKKRIKHALSAKPACCLEENTDLEDNFVSFYQFFRNVILKESAGNKTSIDVTVCGLKNFIVQNDESVMDVNGPVYPFGARPKIGSNFYIGSEEIFTKHWTDIMINVNWQNKPTNFYKYYNGYQNFSYSSGESDRVRSKDFKIQMGVLQDGEWQNWKYGLNCDNTDSLRTRLFRRSWLVPDFGCSNDNAYGYQFLIDRNSDFLPALPDPAEENKYTGTKKLDVNTRFGFIRMTLACRDFQHDKYAFVLARQMSALGKLPEFVDGAVYYGVVATGTPPSFVELDFRALLQEIVAKYNVSVNPANLKIKTKDLVNNLITVANASGPIDNTIWDQVFYIDDPANPGNPPPALPPVGVVNETNSKYYVTLAEILDWLKQKNDLLTDFFSKGVVIPKEPWTPTIKNISLDYKATADIQDIDFIHLYPFDGTYKYEEIQESPSLFPTFCDEGNLFIGLKGLVPGNNLNMLFQLAEATADSESEREELKWHYLDNNQWKSLRDGFEVLEDATDGLTTSGIVKFATPENMTNENTIMPKGMHWIKASIVRHSSSVSETIGIHPQAIQVVFTNTEENDKLRLDKPLLAKSLSKLTDADANIKKVEQSYDSFGGREPEVEKHYYLRVSELLRHKGRAIQKWDYEHIVLESFPQIYRTKCINHSYALNAYEYINDFPVAPGYVLLAVIPDLTKLKAGNSFEPKAPVSLIEEITKYVRKRTSPFVRFRVMNPRYEKIDFCLKVKLYKGRDENYYKEKLAEDLRNFLAPWAVGDYDKLKFGQCVNRSDLLRFLEGLDYLDYVIELKMKHERDDEPDAIRQEICPKTPRSILFAGEIDICIPDDACDQWEECLDASGKSKCCDKDPIPVVDYCSDKKIRKIIKDNS